MDVFSQLIHNDGAILLDGAMGTMLLAAGMHSGTPPETWNVSHPEIVRGIHRRYIEAGARIILTNSFGGNRYRLGMHGLEGRVKELNKAAGCNARMTADSSLLPVLVAGSIGPTGQLLKPYGPLSVEDVIAAYAEQAIGLVEGGVQMFWIETMVDLGEAMAAVEGVRSTSDLPVAVTMTFVRHGRTIMGVGPDTAVQELGKLDLAAIGANCGNGPEEILQVIQVMHVTSPQTLLIAKSNAGLPELRDSGIFYDGTPELMAEYARKARSAGAKLIGGCCGTTPAHIEAMAKALS